MIIKKKYTTIKRMSDENVSGEAVAPDENSDVKKIISEAIESEYPETNSEAKQEEETEDTPPKSKKKKKTMADLDVTLDNIKFDQREERREGNRRRGYRRTQDRNIVSRAQKEAESIKEFAKKEGYEAGVANAQKDLEELKGKFAEFFNVKDEVFNKVSECILEVSVEIAKKIINKTVETDKEYILPIIKGVVEEINKTENKITLKVMPKDVEIVRDNIESIFSGNYFEAAISVIPDKDVKDGGVIVETSNGIIDASIGTQLSIIEKAFKKKEES